VYISLYQACCYSPLIISSPLLLRGAPDTARIYRATVPEFHAEAPQATASEGLAKGPYVAARVGVELMTLRTKGVDSANAPPTPHNFCHFNNFNYRLIALNYFFRNEIEINNSSLLRFASSTINKCKIQVANRL